MTSVEAIQRGNIVTGEVKGVDMGTSVQLPDIPCREVLFVTSHAGEGIWIGNSSVVAPSGSTNSVTGFELLPGHQSPPIPCFNLNQFWLIGTNSITYMANT